MLRRARQVKKKGFTRYKGTPEEICTQIVKRCFNGNFFQVSAGHFREFYMRDFGICAQALLDLGYRDEVYKSLQYALVIFSRTGRITTTITPDDKPKDFFSYASDSLPLLIRSLKIAEAKDLLATYKPFIEAQTQKYYERVFDTRNCMVKKGYFSSMKDNAKRESSCYDNCMLAMLSRDLDTIGLYNPFAGFDIKGALKKSLWNGKHFYDDRNRRAYVAGDANVFPYWCDIFDDKSMLESSISAIRKANIDNQWPLKYTARKVSRPIFPMSILLPDYEADTVWMHLGLCYLDIVARYDKSLLKTYLKKIADVIEEQKNFLELYHPGGSPYRKFHYASDESMLWAVKFLALSESVNYKY